MSLVAQCLRGSGPVPRSQSRIRLKARVNKVLASLQANNARSEGLNGRPSDDRCAPPPCMPRGLAEQREFVFNPDTQIGVGIDPGVTQAVSAASGGLQCSAEHAAHWGEQVASTGAVLLARAGSSASQGQGVPGLGYKRLRDKPPKAQPGAAQ
ncbi:hypothetical protein HaLaN_15296 [Haematococcus lacustris]|uniref:Uncharacterized protein n=1 Tax=Haematococcus lacustris TaxID=44745 RepID=A0A699ZAN7_HAELA|nr:hypothetical protein HaLaN_15296 [Haematococcus lacustris]